jgi:valyl-tRNA synthetase
MTPDGRINENGLHFKGMTMEEARAAVLAEMKGLGLLEKAEQHTNRVGVSYRSKAVIEPYLSKQWFVKMDTFGTKLREAVASENVRLIPKNWNNTYFHWIDNLRDWCISRQLWWGHRIPIWYNIEDPSKMICYDGTGVPPEVAKNPGLWKQDEDVLDTWFSSALWPFATLGWPNETDTLKKFFPNSVLVTGHDILFFWVARMILMGEYALNKAPFPEVFLHGLIYGKSYWRELQGGGIRYVPEEEKLEYDLGKAIPKEVKSKWEKMSKSKGNVIDPIEVIDMYGADAMRMALCASPSQSRQIDLDRRRFEEFKNFANKVWNGARFVFLNLEGDPKNGTSALTPEAFSEGLNSELFTLEDHWILSALNRLIKEVNQHLHDYEFDQAALKAYDFFWKEFCAYYVEIAKPILFGKAGSPELRQNKQKILAIVLCKAVRLLHPMAPFITEELFQLLKSRLGNCTASEHADPYTSETIRALQNDACAIAHYPRVIAERDIDPQINETFEFLEKVIYSIRNIRGEMKLSPGLATNVHIVAKASDPRLILLQNNHHILSSLVPIKEIVFDSVDGVLGLKGSAMVESVKILLPLPSELQEKELIRLQKEQERLNKALEKTKTQLLNEEFRAKAPPELIGKLEGQVAQTTKDLNEIDTQIGQLK